MLVGVLLGVHSARKPNGISSHFVTLFALFGYAAPVFWTGILLLITFSLNIPLFPVAGMADATVEGGFFVKAADIARHMVLPVITLSSIFFALYSRLCRASMMEVLGSDHVRTAKAKGLSEREVVLKHALKNSLSPVVTLAGLQFSAVVSGAVLVETVFSWPGLGTLALQSIIAGGHADHPRHSVLLCTGGDCRQPADRHRIAPDRSKGGEQIMSVEPVNETVEKARSPFSEAL